GHVEHRPREPAPDEGAHDAKHDGPDESLAATHDQVRDDPRYGTQDDPRDDAHRGLLTTDRRHIRSRRGAPQPSARSYRGHFAIPLHGARRPLHPSDG